MFRLFFDARKVRDYGIGTYIRCFLPTLWEHTHEAVRWFIGVHPQDVDSTRFGPNRPPQIHWIPLRYRTYHPLSQFEIPIKLKSSRIHLAHFPHFPVPVALDSPIIVTIHDTILLERWPGMRIPWKPAVARLYLKETLHRADAVVTVSHTVARTLQQMFKLGSKPLVVAHNAPHPIFLNPPAPDVIHRWMIKLDLPEKGFLLYVGNLKPHKNIPRLIQAWKILRRRGVDLPLVLAGMPPGARRQILKALAGESLEGALRVLPWVPLEGLHAVYHRATVLVQPSLAEGFGLPVLEAMMCGTPVACSDIPVFHEIAGDAATYFPPDNPVAIALAIERVLTQPEFARQLVSKGRHRARSFQWEKTVRMVWNLYRHFLPDLPELKLAASPATATPGRS